MRFKFLCLRRADSVADVILFDEVTVRRTEFHNRESFPAVSPDTEYISLTLDHIIISDQFKSDYKRFRNPRRTARTARLNVPSEKKEIAYSFLSSLYSLQDSARTSRLGEVIVQSEVWRASDFDKEGMKSGEKPSAAAEARQGQNHRHERIATRAKIDAVVRVMAGESIESLSRELNVTVHRIERWKTTFIEGGSAELSKKKEVRSENWASKHASSIQQWMWLLFAMLVVITMLVLYAGRNSPE
jgi:hypothetical protein